MWFSLLHYGYIKNDVLSKLLYNRGHVSTLHYPSQAYLQEPVSTRIQILQAPYGDVRRIRGNGLERKTGRMLRMFRESGEGEETPRMWPLDSHKLCNSERESQLSPVSCGSQVEYEATNRDFEVQSNNGRGCDDSWYFI